MLSPWQPKSLVIFCGNWLLFWGLLNYLPFEPSINQGISLLTLIAIFWLTEVIHVSITALLVPLMAATLGIFDSVTALSSFADPIIFLFLGGFALAAALRVQGLDQRMAQSLLSLAGGHLGRALILIFIVSAVLSMWISNTAATAMMLPLVLGILQKTHPEKHQNTTVFALLGIAYCASIGGIATLVGSPPNAIAASHTGLSFSEWMRMALPLTLLLLPIAIGLLYWRLKPNLNDTVIMDAGAIEWRASQMLTLIIFLAAVLGWVFSTPLASILGGISHVDTWVAIMALIALIVTGVTDWKSIERNTDWSVLMLFGGGLCLSAVLSHTGTSLFLAGYITQWLANASLLWTLLGITTFVVILTGFASNTASAALLIPLFMAIAESMSLNPVMMASIIAIAASCAFMLPVATPPNAIVYGSGYVPQKDMLRTGFWLSVVCILVISAYALLFWA